jgi:hypothetical protein
MEIIPLLRLAKPSVGAVLAAAERFHASGEIPLTHFDGFPTAMLFRPTHGFTGSMHYMFFPARADQGFHHHPSSRYLLLLGDVDMAIHHSDAGPESDPHDSEQVAIIPAGTLGAVRFPAKYWHSFRTNSASGRGVMAFTFHEDDAIRPGQIVTDALMEQETTFWRNHEP